MTDAVQVGSLVAGRFQVEALIGRGGMGAVYRAVDIQLGRQVALKVFGSLDESDADRRQSEMRALARLAHPNLVALFDAQVGPSSPNYLVMEFVDGPSLRDAISAGTLDGTTIAEVAIGVAKALAAVHDAGLVHRDIKPANVLLAPTGEAKAPVRAKLVDFGISHLVGSTRITRRDSIIGTGEYLAPEQISGSGITPASDVYALGLVLLECFSGHPAFPGGTPEAILVRMHRDPTISADVPPRWAQLLRQLTDREPERRPDARTMAGIAIALAPDLQSWAPAPELSTRATTVAMTVPMDSPVPQTAALPAQGNGGSFPAVLETAMERPEGPSIARRPGLLIGAATALAVLMAGLLIFGVNSMLGGDLTPAPAPSTIAPATSQSSTPAPVSTTPPVAPANNGKGNKNGKGNGHGNKP
jgi:serine/threonine protein kinase